MTRLRLLLAAALALSFTPLFAEPAPTPADAPVATFAPAAPDLRADPALAFGRLDNGLRYAIRRNTEPRGRAAFRLVILAGSFHETDDQRGLAHFLEHMAFNGSAHYPAGTLVEFFQRMGMNFGGDTNAYTSFDHTAYLLDLPDTRPETVAEGLKVFADFAGGLLLSTAEIESERGVILSEKRARDSADYRTSIAGYEFLFGGTLLPRRIPIGDEEVLKHAGRDRFADFYDAWYRPDRMAVIAVGDFEPAAIEKLIRDAFAALAPRAPARPAPDLGAVPAPGALQVAYHHEAEASATTVSLQVVRPYSHEPDTAERRLRHLPRDLALAMLNRRLDILAKAPDAPFASASAGAQEAFDLFHLAAVELVTAPENWRAAVATAEHELRRALGHGFRPSELAEARANVRNALEQAVKTAPTRRSEEHAAELTSVFVDRLVPTSAEDDLALFGPALEKATVDDCLAALRAAFEAPQFHLSVMGNAALGDDAPAALRAAYEEAAAQPVGPPPADADDAFAYTDFGPAGEVVKREHVADLDLTLVTFANGVRLNLKKTGFEAGRIALTARVGTGQLEEPRDRPGLAFLAGVTFTAGGLGRHSADDLARLLAGRNVGIGFSAAPDAFVFSGSTTPDDLPLQLQLLAAYLTDPGYRPESLRLARKNLEQLYTRLEHTPTGPLQLVVPRLLAGGDPRFGLPSRADAMSRTLDELRAWLAPQLASGPIELALAGDFDADAVIAAVARTLGAFPARNAKPPLDDARRVTIPAEPLVQTLTVPTEIPKGVLAFFWPTDDALDASRTRRLNLLGDIFADRLRLKVREELGGAYSPGAANTSSDTFPGYGWLRATVMIDPDRAPEIADAILAIARDLHAHGVTDDELARARLPLLTALRESARTNGYWLGAVLASAQEQPQRLDWARTRTSDVEAITKAELDALARTYLDPARAFRFTLLPSTP